MSGEVGMAVVRVTDETTRAVLAATLTRINAHAIRVPHVMSKDERWPSEWDRAHRRINALLDDMDQATA